MYINQLWPCIITIITTYNTSRALCKKKETVISNNPTYPDNFLHILEDFFEFSVDVGVRHSDHHTSCNT